MGNIKSEERLLSGKISDNQSKRDGNQQWYLVISTHLISWVTNILKLVGTKNDT